MDSVQTTLLHLAELISYYPVSLFFLYLIACFYPLSFAKMVRYLLAGLALWGLYIHFDDNFSWYLDTANRFGLLKPPDDIVSATESYNKARNIYHLVAIAVAAGLIVVPIISARWQNRQSKS